MSESESGSEYEPDAWELQELEEDRQMETRTGRRGPTGVPAGGGEGSAAQRGAEGASDDLATDASSASDDEDDGDRTADETTAGMTDVDGGESGYTTAVGEEDSDEVQLFTDQLNPIDMLSNLASVGNRERLEPTSTSMEPFQILRRSRTAVGKAGKRGGRAGPSRAPAGDEDAHMGDVEDEGPRPGRRGRPRKSKDGGPTGRSRRTSGPGQGAFGADVDDIARVHFLDNDALAQELGLVDGGGRGRGGRGRGGRKRRGRKREVPEHVTEQLSQATLMYARGDFREAVDLMMNVIKEAPNLADPYHTLGLLHEAMGNPRKALDFYIIAAHLTPKDVAQWKRLAQLSTDCNFHRQAIYCLSKAIAHAPGKGDPDARYDRAVLHAELGEFGKAVQQLERVAVLHPGHDRVPAMLARIYHVQGQCAKAAATLETFITEHPDRASLSLVNMLAEAYMDGREFAKTHELIASTMQALNEGTMAPEFDVGEGEEPLPLELAVKDGLCLAHMGRMEEAHGALRRLAEQPAAQATDLYLEVGQALVAMGQYAAARSFLERLLEVPDYSADPSLWARLLMCYRALDDIPTAVALYARKMADLAPEHPAYLDTLVTLTELYVQAGQRAEAAALLESAAPVPAAVDSDGVASPDLLVRKNKLHLQLGQRQAFIASVLPLVQDALSKLEDDRNAVNDLNVSKDVQRAIMRRRQRDRKGVTRDPDGNAEGGLFRRRPIDRRREHVRRADEEAEALLAARSGGEESDGGDLVGAGGSSSQASRVTTLRAMFAEEDGITTFSTLCRELAASGDVAQALGLAERARSLCSQTSKWFSRERRATLALLVAEMKVEAGKPEAALKLLKPLMSNWPHSHTAWTLLARIAHHPSMATHRGLPLLVQAMRKRQPFCLPATIMHGHLLAGAKRAYQDALSEYFQAYRVWPDEPLLLLCIGMTYINLASSRRVDDRNKAILRGFAFLQMYEQARGDPHEAAYNLGRAAHQLGLLHLADHYYRRALAAAPCRGVRGPCPGTDLCREAAYNLALIYRASGATQLVRQLYLRYLTIL